MRFRLFLLSLSLVCVMHAQTFMPKAIRVEGVPATEQAGVVAITGLKPGSMTKEEIETALGKLADSGEYKDISYTVGPQALVITVTPLASHAPAAVRFSNFLWWDDADLEKQLEARVPGFHGKLRQATPLAEQIEAALVAIAAERGVKIDKVDVLPSAHGMVLAIVSPPVLCGKLTVPEVKPVEGGNFETFQKALYDQEFDKAETPGLIAHDSEEIYQNSGYLDAKAGVPAFAAPRMENGKYFVDITETIDRGELYKVSSVSLVGVDAKQVIDYDKRVRVAKGDTVAPVLFRATSDGLKGGLVMKGYLDAEVSGGRQVDASAHTVSYTFTATPGELYHLARISVEGTLPQDVGPALQKDKRLAAGVVADTFALGAAMQDLKAVGALQLASLQFKASPDDHTASLVVTPTRHGSH